MPRIRSVWARGERLALHALRAGKGPALLLLASPVIAAGPYRPTIRALARAFDVIVLELPGSGRSSPVARSPSDADHARAALRFLDVAGVRHALVVGHSNSGPAALELALLAPERVAGLVLVDTVGADGPDRLARMLPARAADAVLEPGLTVRGSLHVAWNLAAHTRAFADQLAAAARADLRRRAPAVRVPTLVAWGAADATVLPERGAALASRIPGAAFALGPGGHDWLIVHPREFADAITMFVAVRRARLIVAARRAARGGPPPGDPTSPAAPPS